MAHNVLVNGQKEVAVPPDDPGLNRGWSVFETFRTYGTAIFRLKNHLARLQASADHFGIALPDPQTLRAEIEQVIAENVWIRVTLTGANRIVLAHPIDQTRIGRGLRAASVPWEPDPWFPGTIKHGSRAGWMMAARHHQVEEVIFTDRNGFVLEANRSNVFAVIDGVIYTSKADGRILEGVTRGALIDAAHRADLPIYEQPFSLGGDVDELYVSSTLKELAPVVELNGQPMTTEFGPVGLKLYNAFRELVASESSNT